LLNEVFGPKLIYFLFVSISYYLLKARSEIQLTLSAKTLSHLQMTTVLPLL